MFEHWRTRRFARKVGSTLQRDAVQPAGWRPWLDGAGSRHDLRAGCSEPGWLVHVAYWSDAGQDALIDGALRVAAVAWDVPRLAMVLAPEHRVVLVDWRTQPSDGLQMLVAELEERFPKVQAVLSLPAYGVGTVAKIGVIAARQRARTDSGGTPPDSIAGYRGHASTRDEAGMQEHAAAGFALVAVAILCRETGHRDALATAAASGVALLAGACPTAKPTMLELLRSTYGWG
jgi:hypothetical protein